MKYDNHRNYIEELFMIESEGVDGLKFYQEKYKGEIEGYIIGHWTNEEEEFEYGTPMVFRNFSKGEKLDQEWLDSVNHETEFIGILFSHYERKGLPKEVEYTLLVDTKENRVGYYYVGVGLDG